MDDTAGIYAREFDLLDRFGQLGMAQGRVISVSFPVAPEDDAVADHDLLDRIEAYLDGVEKAFSDVTIALTVPTDQREVLQAVRGIPYGTQIGVEKIATMTAGLDPESDDDQRGIRDALAANPAPLLIPDHRVRDGPSAAPPDVVQTLQSLESL
jgi:methylated-DNA-[protein]-cysteine S-methyltransferase